MRISDRSRCRRFLTTLIFALLVFTTSGNGQAQTGEFYNGKTVRILVGATPGGFYDRWARLLSRYIPKYIPGNPNFVVQNMPGAGSVVVANYTYNMAKPDGLTLVMPLNSLHLDQIVGRPEVKYDLRKFEYIGSQEKTPTMMYFRADSPIKTLGDIIAAKEPPKCGSSGTTSTAYTVSKLLNEAFKAKTISISGYQGGSEIDLAVERGEIICRQMDVPPHFGREPFDGWHKRNFDRHIFQGGPKRDARLAEVPTLFELLDQYKAPTIMRSLTRIILASGEMGRPMMAGPGVPAERIKALREAYARAMRDPGLIEEAKKGQMDLEHTSGEELQGQIKEMMSQPREVIDLVKKVLAD